MNLRRPSAASFPASPRSHGPLLAAVGLALSLVPHPAAAQALVPAATPEGVGQALVRHAGLEGRVLWMDGTANIGRLSTREGVANIMERCRRANVNTVVVDVKPLSGHVLYNS